MAYIAYGQSTVGGKQLAELCADTQRVADRWRDIQAWIGQIGVSTLHSNTDFIVGSSDSNQAFNDTVAQINTDMVTFMATNREKIERLARGS